MSPLRNLVQLRCGCWLFLLTRQEVEHSPDQPQSSYHPQVRLDNSAHIETETGEFYQGGT